VVARLARANRKQAFIPEGFELIANSGGTAPGFSGRIGGCRLVCLPGPPRELRPMFLEQVLPAIEADLGLPEREELTVSVFMVPESGLEEELAAAGAPEVVWGTQVEEDRILLFLRSGTVGARRAVLERLQDRLGRVRVREGDVRPLDAVFDLLRSRRQTVAVAESCTGGYRSTVFTDRTGSSDVFMGGLITYSNQAKVGLLGVDEAVILRNGAVSDEVVGEMAAGACREMGADWGIGISGVAGPAGGTPEKPVGTVWIGTAQRGAGGFSRRFHFSGPRSLVRRRSVYTALLILEQCVLGTERLDIIFDW